MVYFFSVPQNAQEETNWVLTERMLELAAQITEREGVGIGIVDLSKFSNVHDFFLTKWKKY